MDSISSVSRNALILRWNKACEFEPTEKRTEVDEEELKPDKQPIEVSYDENEQNPQADINEKLKQS